MIVVTWNLNGALSSSKTWDLICEINPDVALLQEVGSISETITNTYSVLERKAARRGGGKQRFGTVILAKDAVIKERQLVSSLDWVNQKIVKYDGNLISAEVNINGMHLNLVSVYSPAWKLDVNEVPLEEVNKIRLTGHPNVCLTEV